MGLFKKKEPTVIDVLIEEIETKMLRTDEREEDYAILLTNLERLNELKLKNNQKLDKQQKAAIICNLLGIGIIVGFERNNIITSKALGLIFKGRV